MDISLALVSDLVVKSTLVLTTAFGLSLALRGSRPAIRHRLWKATVLFSLLLPLICLNRHTVPIRVLPPSGTAKPSTPERTLPHFTSQTSAGLSKLSLPPATTNSDLSRSGNISSGPMDNLTSSPAPQARSFSIVPSLLEVAVILWTGMTAILMLATVARLMAARRLVAGCEPVYGREALEDDRIPGLAGMIRSSCERLSPSHDNLSRLRHHWLQNRLTVRVGVSAKFPKVPMTCGVFHPVILLPQDSVLWPRRQLESAILHEMAHVMRGDWLLTVASHVAVALYWFNPLIWRAATLLRYEAEECADAVVLMSGVAPISYARHLLAVAQSLAAGDRPVAVVAMAGQTDVSRRLISVLKFTQGKTLWKIRDRLVAAVVCAVLIGMAGVRIAPHSRLAVRERSAALHLERWFATGGDTCLTFTPDSARLLVGRFDGREARRGLWSVHSGRPVSEKLVPVPMTAAAYSYDGRTLATGYGDGTVRLSNSDTGHTVKELRLSHAAIGIIQFSPDDLTVAASGNDGTALIETATGKRRGPEYAGIFRRISGRPSAAYVVAPDRWRIVQWNHEVTLWSPRDGAGVQRLSVRADGCAVHGKALAVLSGDRLELWNIDSRTMIASTSIGGNAGDRARIAFSPDGERIAIACHGVVELWSVSEDMFRTT